VSTVLTFNSVLTSFLLLTTESHSGKEELWC
jgi:hypothetical protein